MRLARTVAPMALGLWLVAAPAAFALDPFRQLSDEEQRRVDQGEIIVHLEATDAPLRRFLVVGQIDAPAARVYQIYTDFDHHRDIFGHRACAIKKREGNHLTVYAQLEMPWIFGDRWVMNETRMFPEDLSFTYRRLEGSIQEYVGTLDIVPKGPARCQVVYTAKVDMGIPFMPRWFVERVQEVQMPSAIFLVRQHLSRQAARP